MGPDVVEPGRGDGGAGEARQSAAALRRAGRDIDDEVLEHIWPTHHENVHFYGTHSVDIDGERDTDGYRALRLPEPAAASPGG